MKLRTRPAALLATLLLGAIIGMGGCATSGVKQAAKTTSAMQTVENDIKQAVVQVDATMASLDDLMAPGQSDRKRAFDKYSDNVARTEHLGKQLLKHADQMAARGEKYFEGWDKQGNAYTDPQIRELSDQRLEELVTIYVEIPLAGIAVREAYPVYLSDIKKIQADLSNDLTPRGIEAVAPVARKAAKDADRLKDAVKPVIYAIDRTKAELAQGGSKK
jgi:hypothetical protein